MKKTDVRPDKTRAMFISWLDGLLCLTLLSAFVYLIFFFRFAEKPAAVLCLQLAAIIVLGYSIWWMLFADVRLVEGEFLFAEYGGVGNRLLRLRFRDGLVWEFSEPPDIPLRLEPKDGCRLYVSVYENFFGRVSIRYCMINCYSGENEWLDDDVWF
ncbi:MAG: hypothetical protein WCT10_05830 [Patescibacteria group bacterium]|jgi:hypothetical protein